MAQSIILQGVTYNDVPAVDLPTADSTARFYDHPEGIFLPPGAVLVASNDITINLSADTSWDSITPSTSNQMILATGDVRGACSYTFDDYENTAAIGICGYHTEFVYADDVIPGAGYAVSKTAISISHYEPILWTHPSRDYYSLLHSNSSYRLLYHTSGTDFAVYTSGNYGIGVSAISELTVSNTSNAGSRTLGFARSALYARCHDRYFSAAAAADIDSANTNIYCKYRIWAFDKRESVFYKAFDMESGILFGGA